MDEEWVLISSYSRKQAIEDGVLIDITTLANGTLGKIMLLGIQDVPSANGCLG